MNGAADHDGLPPTHFKKGDSIMGKKRHTRYKVIAHFDGETEAADVFAEIIEFRLREKKRREAKQILEKGTVCAYNGHTVRNDYSYASRLCG